MTSQLSEDVYQYDAHVECIQLLRQLGDLERVRRAREEMSRVFPLSEGVAQMTLTNLAMINFRSLVIMVAR